MPVTLVVRAVKSQLVGCPPDAEAEVDKALSYWAKDFAFLGLPVEKRKVHLYSVKSGKFLTGFMGIVEGILLKNGIHPEIEDLRCHLPIDIKTAGGRLKHIPVPFRPYQTDGVIEGLRQRRGIYAWGTGAGKTLEMAMLLVAFNASSLVLVENTSLAQQLVEDLGELTGCEVGLIQGGCWDPKSFTVAVVDSLRIRKGTTTGNKERILKFCVNTRLLLVDECLDPDTLVWTPSGPRRLGMLRVGDEVMAPSGRRCRIVRIWSSLKPAFEYRLKSGRKLVGSEDHLMPFAVRRGGWMYLDARPIREANVLWAMRPPAQKLGFLWWDYFVGLFIANGCFDRSGVKFGFRKWKREREILYRKVAVELGVHVAISQGSRGELVVRFPKEIGDRLRAIGFRPGPKRRVVRIPQPMVSEGSVGVVKGIFDSEGGEGSRRYYMEMSSGGCIRDISSILSRHHVGHALLGPYRKKNVLSWRVQLNGLDLVDYNWRFGWEIHVRQPSYLPRRMDRLVDVLDADPIMEVVPRGMRELLDIEIDDPNGFFLLEDGLVAHNCHHESAREFIEVCAYCVNAFDRFGFSGTPYRTDNRDLYLTGLTGPIIHRKTLSELIREGYVARPHIVMPRIDWVPDDPEEWDGDPKRVETGFLVQNEQRNRFGVNFILEHYERRRQVFACVERRRHGAIIRDMLVGAGVHEADIRYVTGSEDKHVRKAARDAFKARKFRILISTRIFHEGMNLPVIDAMVNFAGGKSPIRTLQILGRALRKQMQDGEIDVDRRREEVRDVMDFMDENHKWLKRHAQARYRIYKSESEARVEIV